MNLKNWMSKVLFVKDGEKLILHKGRSAAALILLTVGGVGILIFSSGNSDSSILRRSSRKIQPQTEKEKKINSQSSLPIRSTVKEPYGKTSAKQEKKKVSIAKDSQPKKIKYQAIQVISRADKARGTPLLSIGTRLIGKLLTSVDTRQKDVLCKVLLPYGKGAISKGTIVFGKLRYPGYGERVFIKFDQALLPDGNMMKFQADALSSKDYSQGILGQFHSQAAVRVATTVGLGAVSAMAETLTEKESLGEGVVTPKASLRNAWYQGIAKASKSEAERSASNLKSQEEYFTVESGKDMIIHLTRGYYGEPIKAKP